MISFGALKACAEIIDGFLEGKITINQALEAWPKDFRALNAWLNVLPENILDAGWLQLVHIHNDADIFLKDKEYKQSSFTKLRDISRQIDEMIRDEDRDSTVKS